MKKHSIRALILIAATVLALASCSGGNKPAGTTDGSKTRPERRRRAPQEPAKAQRTAALKPPPP